MYVLVRRGGGAGCTRTAKGGGISHTMFVQCLLGLYVLTTSKVTSAWALTYDGAHRHDDLKLYSPMVLSFRQFS